MTDLKCSICLENIFPVEPLSETDCNHSYHRNCLELWLVEHASCPLCRSLLDDLPPHGTTVPIIQQTEFSPFFPSDFHAGFVIITTVQRRPRRRTRRRVRVQDMYRHSRRSDRSYDRGDN